MVLDMTPILSGKCTCIPFEFDFRPEPDSYVQEVFSDLQYPVPMHISGMVTDQAGYMSLHAQVIVKYVTACARCAEPVDGEKQFSFEKDIADSNVTDENEDYVFIHDKQLDLQEPLEEQLMLELPAKTLCRDDCKGLCQKCGKNLNFGSCNCPEDEGDPRWAALRALLKNNSDSQ